MMTSSAIAVRWSEKLGLALSGLFGTPDRQFGPESHYALLDGVAASFSLSVASKEVHDQRMPASWAWSANMRKHVWVDSSRNAVSITSVARPNESEEYSVNEVDQNLDRFLEYLSGDRHAPKRSVVDQLLQNLDFFRECANETSQGASADLVATQALLLHMARLSEPGIENLEELGRKYLLPVENISDISRLVRQIVDTGINDSPFGEQYTLHSGIAVRHAGGAIFQRATAKLTYSSQLQLFTGTRSAHFGSSESLKNGGYFTPPGLARCLAEAAIQGKTQQPTLRICDPTCGSGVFLAEVVKALTRINYTGNIELVGRDISPFAVQITRFVAKSAALDFDANRVTIDVELSDTLLDPPSGMFDIILMNPPFRSWEQSNSMDRALIKNQLNGVLTGKPDLSLAFANLAYGLLKNNGVLATLLPIGILTSDYSSKWREKISQESEIRLIGSLGDHYIFDFAMVNISALVIRRVTPELYRNAKTLMLWANEDPRASSTALRNLRKGEYVSPSDDGTGIWRTYQIPQTELIRRNNWTPSGSGKERAIENMRMRNFPRLSELFKVQQGIRTGARAAFILSNEQVKGLPLAERVGFRSACEKDGISKFQISSISQVFFADTLAEPIQDEQDFKNRFPTYFEQNISPNLDILKARPRNVKIWNLSWSRAWLRKIEPRIVSRMFVGPRQLGFAVDEAGRYAVVQGYGWNPIWKKIAPGATAEDKLLILHAYAFLFASELFFDLVKTVSVNIAGGQYDLAPKYISDLPIPDWSQIKSFASGQFDRIETVRELASVFADKPSELEKFAQAAFGMRSGTNN